MIEVPLGSRRLQENQAVAKTATKKNSKRRTSMKSMKKSAVRKTRPSRATRTASKAAVSAGDVEVTLDRRRGPRRGDEPQPADVAVAPTPQMERRQKVNRRRQIDPTTCERDYTEHEVEFMNALDDYKRKSGRMFPTCSEVLEVIHSLGYVKLSAAEILSVPGASLSAASAKPMPSNWATSPELADSSAE